MKKNQTDETAVTTVAETVEVEVKETVDEKNSKQQSKQSLFKTISGVINFIPTVQDAYASWVKPIYDNRAQISRRLSAVSTVISLVFFLLYIPFLLLGKLYKEVSLGLDIAIYVCIGVYVVTIVVLFAVTAAGGASTSTAIAKKRKKARKIVLVVVRFASLAIAITALIISAASGTKNSVGATLDTIAIIFSVMSIIFTSLPLIFGGMAGFIHWLISPAKMKYRFSFVANEWYLSLTSEKQLNKTIKKAAKKYGEKIGAILDTYLLPAFGKKYLYAIDRSALLKVLESVSEESKNITEWIIKEIFEYAEECGYVRVNPCKDMDLEGDIGLEDKPKKADKETKPKRRKLSEVFGKNKE